MARARHALLLPQVGGEEGDPRQAQNFRSHRCRLARRGAALGPSAGAQNRGGARHLRLLLYRGRVVLWAACAGDAMQGGAPGRMALSSHGLGLLAAP